MLAGFFGGGGSKDKSGKPQCSPNDYVRDKLEKMDADNFAAAGILVINPHGPASLEMLLGRSSSKTELEFLGGKRDQGEDVYTTASREFDEETAGVLGEIKKDLSHRQQLMKACRDSPVFWFARGRYALFLVSAPKLHNLVWFDPPSDTLSKRHKAFIQSGKAKSKSSSFQEMQELMWIPFANPMLPHGQKAREFMRSVFESAVFKVWLHTSIYGQKPYNLYLSGLDWNSKEKDIRGILEQVGPCKVTLEPHDDQSKDYKTNGRGIVIFDDRHHATTAVYLFNKSTYGGRPLSLAWAPEPVASAVGSGHSASGGGAHGGGAGSSYLPAHGSTPVAPTSLPGFQPAYSGAVQPSHAGTGIRGQSGPAPAVSPPVVHVSHVPAPAHPLPVGWIEQIATSGHTFYVNPEKNITQWERPHAPPPPPVHSHAPPPPSTYSQAPPPPAQASYSSAPPPAFLDRAMPPPTAAYGAPPPSSGSYPHPPTSGY